MESHAVSSPSLSSPSLSSTDSLNTLYMSNTAHNLSDTSYNCNVSDSSITSNVESVVEGVESLDTKTARSITLAILSRIARLLGISLDELLTALLPLSSASFETTQPSPRCERLVEWGRIVHANLTQTDENGFVEGIPVSRVVKSSALAYLHALADWPTKANRVQLLEESVAVMDDFLTTASTGFLILPSQRSKKTHHFLRLVKFILCGFNHSYPLDLTISHPSKDPYLSKEYVGLDHGQFPTAEATIPFIDESRLTTNATSCDSSLVENCNPSSLLEQSPSNVSKVCGIDKLDKHSGSIFTPVPSPPVRCGCFNGPAAAMAIQLALLLLPSELRFQLQVFVERAQEVMANAERHIKPEKTLHYVQPNTLAKWFAPRFFGSSTNLTRSSGHHLLEYILSFPQALQLLKPPSCLDLGIEGWGNRFAEDLEPHHPQLHMLKAAGRRLNLDIVSSPAGASTVSADHEGGESAVGGESRQVSPISCPVDADTASVATGMEPAWDQRTKSRDLEHVLALGNMRHLIHALNYFIDDKNMDPKTKMRYIKQFEETHPDVFWLRFGDSQTASNYYARLRRRIDQSRGGPWGGQSHARLVARFAEIFRLRKHLLTKKSSH
ncbi:unnamed protein product [Taenia asiatica]|uniref:HTH cro/C1-type domain-containing protein n=1 Tax=Taenia asiatica TaxID=60517 RepID=A0A3P6QGB4_TAEAS|nr:unnamed protein product [Taenia asiatica]